MSAIVFESGAWPSRMICGPTWRTLISAPGNAWRIRDSRSLVSIETRTRNETGRSVWSQIVKAGRAERLPIEIQQPRAGLIGEQLDVGDGRVGDHDPASARGGSG